MSSDTSNTGLLDPPVQIRAESTGFQGQDEEHGVDRTPPPSRPLSMAWVSDELLAETIEVWSEAYRCPVDEDEAMEILMNVKRFGEALLEAGKEMNQ